MQATTEQRRNKKTSFQQLHKQKSKKKAPCRRGIQGVRGLCGPGGSIGAVAVLSAEAASGN